MARNNLNPKNSLKTKLSRQILSSFLIAAIVSGFLMLLFLNKMSNLTIESEVKQLYSNKDNNESTLLPGFLIEEQYAGIPIMLQQIRTQENLKDARVVADEEAIQDEFPGCSFQVADGFCLSKNKEVVAVYIPINEGGRIFGYLIKIKKLSKITSQNTALYFSEIFLLAILLVALFLFWRVRSVATKIISQEINQMMNWLDLSIDNKNESSPPQMEFFETRELGFRIAKIMQERKANLEEKAIGNMAVQVAHDIRSPLAALEMLSGSLNELPEERRLIIRNSINRIRDIANSLVIRNENKVNSKLEVETFLPNLTAEKNETQCELLMPIIDLIVTEKRLQYRDQVGIQIDFNQTAESYGLFSMINTNDLKRLLSNLINNSVEAFSLKQGQVTVSMQSAGKYNEIEVKDNGTGIPQHILSQLGKRGATFNKESGSGLGLFHAKSTIETWGGRLDITSELGKGTTVRLLIPKQSTPSWFVPILKIKEHSILVVFDDDQSIHQIWKKRLESLKSDHMKSVHFSSPGDFRSFFRKNFADLDEAVFLMDYEIINHAETGLDLIEECRIQNQAILVTSRFEEKHIRERCENLGVRLIPKSMSGFVPIVSE